MIRPVLQFRNLGSVTPMFLTILAMLTNARAFEWFCCQLRRLAALGAGYAAGWASRQSLRQYFSPETNAFICHSCVKLHVHAGQDFFRTPRHRLGSSVRLQADLPCASATQDMRMSDNSTRRHDHVHKDRDCSCHDDCYRFGGARREQWAPVGNGRLFARPRANAVTDGKRDL